MALTGAGCVWARPFSGQKASPVLHPASTRLLFPACAWVLPVAAAPASRPDPDTAARTGATPFHRPNPTQPQGPGHCPAASPVRRKGPLSLTASRTWPDSEGRIFSLSPLSLRLVSALPVFPFFLSLIPWQRPPAHVTAKGAVPHSLSLLHREPCSAYSVLQSLPAPRKKPIPPWPFP